VKLYLFYVGKPRDPNANALAAEYIKRADRFLRCEMREIKPDGHGWRTRRPEALKVLLDPAGRALSSAQFTSLMARCEREARDAVFVVGGSEGLPQAWKAAADVLLSLSPMTLPHELARVVLAEQIYRAFATLRGHPYPR